MGMLTNQNLLVSVQYSRPTTRCSSANGILNHRWLPFSIHIGIPIGRFDSIRIRYMRLLMFQPTIGHPSCLVNYLSWSIFIPIIWLGGIRIRNFFPTIINVGEVLLSYSRISILPCRINVMIKLTQFDPRKNINKLKLNKIKMIH